MDITYTMVACKLCSKSGPTLYAEMVEYRRNTADASSYKQLHWPFGGRIGRIKRIAQLNSVAVLFTQLMLAVGTRLGVMFDKLSERRKLLTAIQVVIVARVLYFYVSHLAVTPVHQSQPALSHDELWRETVI